MTSDDLDLRHLRTLEAVVRLESFAAAARELGYTQSAVSQQIAELERRVRASVVNRRPVTATAAGRILLAAESSVGTSMSIAAAELAALDEGRTATIRLGAFVSAAAAVVPAALARFRVSNPGARVEVRQFETAQSHDALARGALDLAVTFEYRNDPRRPPAGIRRRKVSSDPVVMVLPRSHPLAGRDRLRLTDVGRDEWIRTPVALPHRDDDGRGDGRGDGRVDFDGDDFHTVVKLVAAGLGVALLPELALHDAPTSVVARPVAGARLERQLFLARLDTRAVPTAVGVLEGYLVDAITAGSPRRRR